jgi:hypothetical protein
LLNYLREKSHRNTDRNAVREWCHACFKQLRELIGNDGLAEIVALGLVTTMCMKKGLGGKITPTAGC